MEDKLELKDPDHPDAEAAATATARLLIAIHKRRTSQNDPDHDRTDEHNTSPAEPHSSSNAE